MNRLLLLLAVLVFPAAASAQSASAQSARVGASLTQALSAARPLDRLSVIVTFRGSGPLTSAQVGLLRQIGVTGVTMRSLPIAGVLATPAQVNLLARTSGVRSVWLNEALAYDNYDARHLTGVERLRADPALRTAAGLPVSGKGIGVVINDSGIDGTLPDLQYGTRVVQNVLGQTNLAAQSALLPITYAENIPNTDIAGGHGTHVAGTVGGSGASSAGRHAGVAPGAGLIGYGSGAGLFILDTIGGFDYALTHQFDYNIRVISNSFGSTTDVGTPFNPDDPTNVATKALADRGIVVVFSAGNSGPGERTITGNFKKAPWVVTVAAGDKLGELADFSSRGQAGAGGTVTVDGQSYTWVDRPTITAPGVGIVSARATTSALAPLGATDDVNLSPGELAFYTHSSGTSMACPHVSGIVALLLEANPRLNVYDVKRILEATATTMPGRDPYEVGAGYANAHAAVAMAFGRRTDYGATVALGQTFNSRVVVNEAETAHEVTFDPSGTGTKTGQIEVAEGTLQLAAFGRVTGVAGETGNLLGLRLTAPDGTRYTSGVPVLFAITTPRSVTVDSPMPGTWTVDLYGVNGAGAPETTTVFAVRKSGTNIVGLSDLAGHPAAGAIKSAVGQRLIDGDADGRYRPSEAITRIEMARFLTLGAGIRQSLALTGVARFSDVPSALAPYAEAVAARGAALKDVRLGHDGVVSATGGAFNPTGTVSRLDLAYALVQSLGLEAAARAYTGSLTADADGRRVPLSDASAIPANRRGYVQIALDLGLLAARFSLTQGPYELTPTLQAAFDGGRTITRGDYAVAATRFYDRYMQGDLNALVSGGAGEGTAPVALSEAAAAIVGADRPTLARPFPNPVTGQSRVRFTMPEAGHARLTLYDALGREVLRLHDGQAAAGTHEQTIDAAMLPAGTYLCRLVSAHGTQTSSLVVVR